MASDKVLITLDREDADLMRLKLEAWETKVPPNIELRSIALESLRAALAAIERADQEEGDRG